MTQINLLQKSKIPKKEALEEAINKLGVDFKFLENFDKFDGLDMVSCQINGVKTSFEIYFDEINDELLENFPKLKSGISDFDCAVSFVWGYDYTAGASVGIISIALIDICNSVSFYADDAMWY